MHAARDRAANPARSRSRRTRSRQLVRYIGAGAIAAAALVTIAKTAPTMVALVRGRRRRGCGAAARAAERPSAPTATCPASVLVFGLVALIAALALIPGVFAGDLPLGGADRGRARRHRLRLPVRPGVVAARRRDRRVVEPDVGDGADHARGDGGRLRARSNWGGAGAKAAVLTVGTVVCVAASKAGDISQDLKTGWLVGATPARQQFGQLIAAAVACWAVAAVVIALGDETPGFGEGGMLARRRRS